MTKHGRFASNTLPESVAASLLYPNYGMYYLKYLPRVQFRKDCFPLQCEMGGVGKLRSFVIWKQ